MEAAIVLPVVIIAVITSVLVIMFFYTQMSERSRLHTVLRSEAGIMTEYTLYGDVPDMPDGYEINMKKPGITGTGEISASKNLLMREKGILTKRGRFTVKGSAYAADAPQYVRYCTFVKGGNVNAK